MDVKKRRRGFTLIELMVVVTIVAIIAMFAYPSYRNYIIRAHRTDAIQGLSKLSVLQEQYFSLNNEFYGVDGCSPTGFGASVSPEGYYNLKVCRGRWSGTDCSAANNDNTKKHQYTLLAIPVAGKSQAEDTDCACLYMDDADNRQATGTSTAKCWG